MRRKKQTLNDGNEEYRKIQANINREKNEKRKRKLKRRFRIFMWIVIIGLLFYGFITYNSNEVSQLTKIEVNGNSSYTVEEIIQKSNINLESRIYLTYGFLIENALNSLPGIESSQVDVNYFDRVVKITIKEYNIMAYTNTHLYYEDGSIQENITQQQYNAPLLVGFEEAIPANLVPALRKVDEAPYKAISEINRNPNKYDDNYLKLVMDNNYYVFTNIEGLSLLNDNYITIVSSNKDANKRCIYIHNESSNPIAVLKTCE